MRIVLFALVAMLLGSAFGPSAGACPPNYMPCGNGLCCPR